MSQTCDHGCGGCAASCGEQTGPPAAPHEFSQIKKIIGVWGGKGGVGKTLVTALLAVEMQRAGYSAAILDADISGPAIPKVFGIREKASVNELGIFPVSSRTGIDIMSINLLLERDTDPVTWQGPIAAGAVRQFWTDVVWSGTDVLFVDLPPGTGDVPLTVFRSIPLDGIIIVTSPQALVSMVVEKAIRTVEKMGIPLLGLVENMSYFRCPDCGKKSYVFGVSAFAETAERYGIAVMDCLPLDPVLSALCDRGEIESSPGALLPKTTAGIQALLKAPIR